MYERGPEASSHLLRGCASKSGETKASGYNYTSFNMPSRHECAGSTSWDGSQWHIHLWAPLTWTKVQKNWRNSNRSQEENENTSNDRLCAHSIVATIIASRFGAHTWGRTHVTQGYDVISLSKALDFIVIRIHSSIDSWTLCKKRYPGWRVSNSGYLHSHIKYGKLSDIKWFDGGWFETVEGGTFRAKWSLNNNDYEARAKLNK